jgi:hypothetical protein
VYFAIIFDLIFGYLNSMYEIFDLKSHIKNCYFSFFLKSEKVVVAKTKTNAFEKRFWTYVDAGNSLPFSISLM